MKAAERGPKRNRRLPQLSHSSTSGEKDNLTNENTTQTSQEEHVKEQVDKAVIEFAALNLACSDQFQDVLRTSSETESFLGGLSCDWLVSIEAPSTQGQNKHNWGALVKQIMREKCDSAVITRATEIFNECAVPRPLPPIAFLQPPSAVEWVEFREDLFRYTHYRRDLLETEKQCHQLYHQLQTENQALDPENPSDSRILTELGLLQDSSRECRAKLSSTGLEVEMIKEIDNLIAGFQETTRATSDKWAENDRNNVDKQTTDLIRQRYNFTPQETGGQAPFSLDRRVGKRVKRSTTQLKARTVSVREEISSHGSLESHDARLIEKIPQVFRQIDEKTFNRRLGQIWAIRTRLPSVAARKGINNHAGKTREIPRAGAYERRASNMIPQRDLVHDNIFHAYTLFQALKDESEGDLPLVEIEQAWLRINAVVAICWGCTSEHVLFLSTLDVLLDQLRTLVGLESNLYTLDVPTSPATPTKQEVLDPRGPHIKQGESDSPDLGRTLNDREDWSLILRHSCQLRFTELALAVHGIAAEVSFLTLPQFQPTEAQREDMHLLQIQSLLRWDDICTICGGRLFFHHVERRRDLVSVAMRDARVGSKIERSAVSLNRKDLYNCFSVIWSRADKVFWFGDQLGPFFFYFAGPSHPECKNVRGKPYS